MRKTLPPLIHTSARFQLTKTQENALLKSGKFPSAVKMIRSFKKPAIDPSVSQKISLNTDKAGRMKVIRDHKTNFVLSRKTRPIIEIGDEPWLYGYASTLIPRSPNPDDALDWSDG